MSSSAPSIWSTPPPTPTRPSPSRFTANCPTSSPTSPAVTPDEIQNAALSPTGARAVFEAHGEIFTVPAEKGDTRNLTNTPGVAERDPSWSPDGKTIAYFSDASGEYQLYLHDQTGFKPPTVIDLGPDPSFFYNPTWSPDSKHIAYTDKHLRLWVVDVPADARPRKPVLVDTGIYGGFGADFGQVWSPDSKWIAYHRDLDNQLHAIFLYSMDTHKSTQVTDGMSDASSPAFDLNGKYLYFLASTDDGPSNAGIDLSSLDRAADHRRLRRGAGQGRRFAHPARERRRKDQGRKEGRAQEGRRRPKKDAKDDKSERRQVREERRGQDAEKEKDKETGKDPGTDKDKDKPVKVTVDLDGIGNRILSLPIPPRNYGGISAGKTGVLYLAEGFALRPLLRRRRRSRHSRHLALHAGKARARNRAHRHRRLHRLRRRLQGALRAARAAGPSPPPTT